jgi:RNA polymerase sigma factor (sigma-70 family)
MMKSESEKQFIQTIEGCRRSNLNCQRSLYEQYYGYGLSIALRYGRNCEEAVEILNDAFLKVFSKLDQYKTDQPFKPWFRRILIHTAIDYHRAQHKFPIHIDIDSVAYLLDDEMVIPDLSPDEDVLPLLQALPPQYRIVFNLYVMEEYDHKEIAATLGITESTSRANLARAKEKLREILAWRVPKTGILTNLKYKSS